MNIAVINIRDLAKCLIIIIILIVIVVAGIKIVVGNEEIKEESFFKQAYNSSFLYCLGLELPIMANEKEESNYKKEELHMHQLLNSELEVLANLDMNDSLELEDKEEIAENVQQEEVQEEKEEDKKLENQENIQTTVIKENNIEASFTNSSNDIQVKNQSKYDITELISNSDYQLVNKDKVVIYHTHTCESYTPSEKYNYEMTGAYRTTDLNFSVAKVRR